MANDYGQPIHSFDANTSKYLDTNLFLTHVNLIHWLRGLRNLEIWIMWKKRESGNNVRRDFILREIFKRGGLKKTGYFKIEYTGGKFQKETVVVKITMKFRSFGGNRIRIVSPSGTRNRKLSPVLSLKVTFLPFEIYRTTMRDVARPTTLSKRRYSFL